MNIPDWAVNKEKYYRAVGICGPEATEEALKDEYRKMAGLVKGETEATADVVLEEKPKKAKAPAKKKK